MARKKEQSGKKHSQKKGDKQSKQHNEKNNSSSLSFEKQKSSKPFITPSYIAYVVILLLVFLYAYQYIFDSKLDLGGDNAFYYILGKALALGEGYVNLNTPDKTPNGHFPPGYPAIMAFFRLFGVTSITGLKILNGVFCILASIAWFEITRKITADKRLGFLVGILLILNASMLRYSTIMMSEIPFTFFLAICFLLMFNINGQNQPWKDPYFYGMVICLVIIFYIRSLGIGMVAGVILYFAYYKNWKYAIFTAIGFIIGVLPWQLAKKGGGGNYVKQLLQKNPYRSEEGMVTVAEMFERIWANFSRYVTTEIPHGMFSFFEQNYKSTSPGDWVSGLFIIAIIITGIYFLNRPYKFLFLAYLICTFGILLVWPEVWYGVRFLLPTIPLLIILFIIGGVSIINLFKNQIGITSGFNPLILLIFVFVLFPPLEKLHKRAEAAPPPQWNNYFKIAKWCEKNTSQDAVITCRKPALFYLYSNRKTVKHAMTKDSQKVIQDMKEKGTDYVVVEQLGFSSTARYLVPAIEDNQYLFKQVLKLKNPETYLLKANL